LLGSPGVTGVDATVAAWDDGQPWLNEVLAQLRANRDWLAATLTAELPGVTMRLPEATYLAWLDCRALEFALPGRAVLSGPGEGRAEFWRNVWCRLRRVRTAEFRDAAGDTEGDCRADGQGGAQAVSL
jgi:aspartate/methionine/tyrosine aminotransferase